MERERCAFCGALNPSDAEWCGMCLRRFPPPEVSIDPIDSPADILLSEEPVVTTNGSSSVPEAPVRPSASASLKPAASGAFTVTDAGIVWTCSRCETKNPLEAQACSVCGTTFAEVIRPQEERPPRDPNMAALLSLFFPGAGHVYLGEIGQAIARGIISLWVVGVVIVALVAGGKSNSGPVAIIFSLVATALWVIAAHDAYREARGETGLVLLKGKVFLYLVLGLLMLLFVFLVGAAFRAQS